MDLLTHLSLSLKLKRHIENNFHIKVNTFRFMWGNIKPDLSPKYAHIPHYKKDSGSFICQEIKTLLETRLSENKPCTGHFSERLGITTHYLSDFFCYAHSEGFTGGNVRHTLYELRISLYFLFRFLKINRPNSEYNNSNQGISTIWQTIEELHTSYSQWADKAQPSIDIAFTLKSCSYLCFSVMATCITDEGDAYRIDELVHSLN